MAMAVGRALIEVILSLFLIIFVIIVVAIVITYEEGKEGCHVVLVHSQEVSLIENLHMDVLNKLQVEIIWQL